MQVTTTVPIEVNGKLICEFEVEVDIGITYRGSPAQTYGPPENCHPARLLNGRRLGIRYLLQCLTKRAKPTKPSRLNALKG